RYARPDGAFADGQSAAGAGERGRRPGHGEALPRPPTAAPAVRPAPHVTGSQVSPARRGSSPYEGAPSRPPPVTRGGLGGAPSGSPLWTSRSLPLWLSRRVHRRSRLEPPSTSRRVSLESRVPADHPGRGGHPRHRGGVHPRRRAVPRPPDG